MRTHKCKRTGSCARNVLMLHIFSITIRAVLLAFVTMIPKYKWFCSGSNAEFFKEKLTPKLSK